MSPIDSPARHQTVVNASHAELSGVPGAPPWSGAARRVAAVSLALGGLLNGLPQYLSEALRGDLTFAEEIAWAADHPGLMQVEQSAMLVSVLFLPVGLLGMAHLLRWRAPRLTVTGLVLAIWGMWGFQNILALGYVPRVVVPAVLSADAADQINEALSAEPGIIATALVPHLVGSFLGLLLLAVLGWRTRVLPRPACALLAAFLIWDFMLPSMGWLEPHLLLAVACTWMGARMTRMSDREWHGGATA